MSLLVTATWRDGDGAFAGPRFDPVETMAEAEGLVRRGLEAGVRAGGRGVGASIMDDLTARILVRVRPGQSA